MMRARRGNTIMELALWMPFLLLLLGGMVQLGKITYVYYTVKKVLYGIAMQISSSQGVNFCDSGDALIAGAKNYALSGAPSGAESMLPALTADLIQVDIECVDPNTGVPGACSVGCDIAAGGVRPDYVIVSIPSGYSITPRFPYMLVDSILLRPEVRVPYGGS
jgi:hypothetical protein